jgi:hypothetical protein
MLLVITISLFLLSVSSLRPIDHRCDLFDACVSCHRGYAGGSRALTHGSAPAPSLPFADAEQLLLLQLGGVAGLHRLTRCCAVSFIAEVRQFLSRCCCPLPIAVLPYGKALERGPATAPRSVASQPPYRG